MEIIKNRKAYRYSEDNIDKFIDYCEQKRNELIENEKNEKINRENFIKDYPLDSIARLKVEDYVVGTGDGRRTLCYDLEFGKYRHTGAGIGGGTSKKYGIYYNKDNNVYRIGDNDIDNIDEVWPKFISQLYSFLKEGANQEKNPSLKDYPMLKGMGMVLAKLLYLYYPNNYESSLSTSLLKKLCQYFGFEYENTMDSFELSFILNKEFKNIYPTIIECGPSCLGSALWRYNKYVLSGSEPSILKKDTSHKYWLYAPGANAELWDEFYSKGIMALGWGKIGNLNDYQNEEEIRLAIQREYESDTSKKNSVLAVSQFYDEVKPGDIVFAKKGNREIVGKGIVTSDYLFDDQDKEFSHVRKVNWIAKGSYISENTYPIKTLTEIKRESLINELESAFDQVSYTKKAYTKDDFLKDVYISSGKFDEIMDMLKVKRNIILQGAPGVGKTFAATKLAYTMIGEINDSYIEFVQFHQNYSYEDFIMGYKPSEEGFYLKPGIFYDFCKKAKDDPEHKYFFIIDEINRGNLSKIFGELLMGIESDYRGPKHEITLSYTDKKFYVPENIYIIGMMNTADRGLALIDYALRRRFSFIDFEPAFDNPGFIDYQNNLNNMIFNNLIEKIKELNNVISKDDSLGDGFRIGHSYFCNLTPNDCTQERLNSIITYDILPTLKEYWFDNKSEYDTWKEELKQAIQ